MRCRSSEEVGMWQSTLTKRRPQAGLSYEVLVDAARAQNFFSIFAISEVLLDFIAESFVVY